MKVWIVRFLLVPGELASEQAGGAVGTSASEVRTQERPPQPIDEKRLGFIKYLVETGAISDDR